MINNIPVELRELPQWVIWRYEVINGRTTKVPYAPHGQYKADSKNPQTWGTFEHAVQSAASSNGEFGIGFVFTENDPYTGIDIDDKESNPASDHERLVHQQILQHFQSYTERSVGGRGYHIIIRGRIPDGEGRDRGHVGVYSSGRYFTMTGDVVRMEPITDCQEMLNELIRQMPEKHAAVELDENAPQLISDEELYRVASTAKNADRFHVLWSGDWANAQNATGRYLYRSRDGQPDHSAADHALLNILAFYTRNNEQVRRMFRYSQLGQRAKAHRPDYLNRSLVQIRAEQPSATDLEAAAASARAIIADLDRPRAPPPPPAAPVAPPPPSAAPVAPPPPVDMRQDFAQILPDVSAQQIVEFLDKQVPAPPAIVTEAETATTELRAPPAGMFPPGLIGEMAEYIYYSSKRPVAGVSLCAALSFMAGIVARQYNISETGLNQYILMVGQTGIGKEEATKGVNRIVHAVRRQIPMIEECIGPAMFGSGQGLVRTLDSKPCFVSFINEFATVLKSISDPRASQTTLYFKRALLDLFSKSGFYDVLRPTAYSDSEKNTKLVQAPNFSFFADATPEEVFESMDAGSIADGLIPRLHVVEIKDQRPSRNKRASMHPLPDGMVNRVAELTSIAFTMKQNNTHCNVEYTEDGLAVLDAFDVECDGYIRQALGQGEVQLWNRGHFKALRLAGLISVGCYPHKPTVTKEIAEWAVDFTRRTVQTVQQRFFTGDVGTGDAKQMADVRRMVVDYFKMDKRALRTYKVDGVLQDSGVVPYSYLVTRCSKLASFYRDARGATRCLNLALETLCASDALNLVDAATAYQRFNKREKLYCAGATW